MKSVDSIISFFEQHKALLDPFDYVCLFGSSINPNVVHNDIDILVVYNEYSDEVKRALRLMCVELEKASGQPVDLTALSIEEENDIAFLDRISPHYIIIK